MRSPKDICGVVNLRLFGELFRAVPNERTGSGASPQNSGHVSIFTHLNHLVHQLYSLINCNTCFYGECFGLV